MRQAQTETQAERYIIADNRKLFFWDGKFWTDDRKRAKQFKKVESARRFGKTTLGHGEFWIVNSVEGGTV